MADKFTEFAGRMGKAPKGVGTGLKLLVAAAAAAYGIKESVYTGIFPSPWLQFNRKQAIGDRYQNFGSTLSSLIGNHSIKS